MVEEPGSEDTQDDSFSFFRSRADRADERPDEHPVTEPAPARRGGLIGAFTYARLWFRAFRRTRPFWGGLWTMLGGLWIIRAMNFGLGLAITGGWSYSAGYTLGGALVLFGLVAWAAPHYKSLVGIMAFAVALIAFVAANLGGYLVGTLLGIVGGSMIWAWGEKKSRNSDRRGAKVLNEPDAEGIE